jgi:hypothetical protein
VIHLTIGDTIELQECRKVLEGALASLDHLGAGLAAIHVNAAIEQLASNLEMIEKALQKSGDQSLSCPNGRPQMIH